MRSALQARLIVSIGLAVFVFTLMYWFYGGEGECSRAQTFKTIISFTVCVIFLDFVRRTAVLRILQRPKSLVGVNAVISALSLILLLVLIDSGPSFYYQNNRYLFEDTWFDMSCITADDIFLGIMVIIGPAFTIVSLVCDLWLMRKQKKAVRAADYLD